MAGLASDNLSIAKTVKLFIGGDFPRTESGRSFPVYVAKTKKLHANVCLASRKDLRNAVTAAQTAQPGWQARTAYNRAQILYRAAEMLESKRPEFVEELMLTLGHTKSVANKAVDGAVNSLVYYAGFADKYQQLMGAVNPVSGPHHNFTTTEPVGVVGLIADATFDLGAFVAQLAAIIVSGNAVVALMAQEGSALLAPLAETFATSDLPKGAVNLLTGHVDELYKHFGSHMEIQSMSVQCRDAKVLGEIREMAAANMKRVVSPVDENLSLQHLLGYLEYKTVWHPVGS